MAHLEYYIHGHNSGNLLIYCKKFNLYTFYIESGFESVPNTLKHLYIINNNVVLFN